MPAKQTQYSTLQAGRAIAAILVTIHHIEIFILPERLYPGQSLWRPLEIGYIGVEFFFALSGFLMAYIHMQDFGQAGRFPRYMKTRLARIYPVYWATVIPLFLLWAVVPFAGPEEMSLGETLLNLTLLPTDGIPMHSVAWTLQFEMLFYVMFGLMLLSKRIGGAIMAGWFGVCAIGLFLPERPYPLHFLTSEYNLIFLFGMMAAYGFRHIEKAAPPALLMAGIGIMCGVALSELYDGWLLGDPGRTVFLGLGAAIILVALAAGESQRGWRAPGWLKQIGDSSYALYLIHIPVMTIGSAVAMKTGFPGPLPVWMTAILLLSVCIVSGLVMHVLIEKPLTRFARHVLVGQPRKALAV